MLRYITHWLQLITRESPKKVTIFNKIMGIIFISSLLFFLALAYIAAHSHFTDINDIIKITDCHEPYAEMCEKTPIIIMLYYLKTPILYFVLPQLAIWLIILFIYRRKDKI